MLTQITSADNAKVKLVRKLSGRKGRNEEGRFVAEGVNLVGGLLAGAYDDYDIDFIMVSHAFEAAGDDERMRALRDAMEDDTTPVCEVSKGIFRKLTDAGHGIEVLAVVKKKAVGMEFIDTLPNETNILVCDRIQDPGNMGTMIRTAVAAGYGAVVAMPGTVDIFSPKVLRSTAGMVFEIPVIYCDNEEDIVEMARKSSRRIAVTVPAGGTEYYLEDLSKGIALVIGNEGSGVSDGIKKTADIGVTLPMKGNIESLNAAIAAAILMYETIRRQEDHR